MLTPVTSLWTLEQTALSVIIVLACLWLALARHRPAQGSSTDAKAAPSRQAGGTGRRSSRVSIVVLAVVLVPVALFLVERGANPIGIRADSWSDANVVISGRNYAR